MKALIVKWIKTPKWCVRLWCAYDAWITSIYAWIDRKIHALGERMMSPLGRVLLVGGVVVFSVLADGGVGRKYSKFWNTIVAPWLQEVAPWVMNLIN